MKFIRLTLGSRGNFHANCLKGGFRISCFPFELYWHMTTLVIKWICCSGNIIKKLKWNVSGKGYLFGLVLCPNYSIRNCYFRVLYDRWKDIFVDKTSWKYTRTKNIKITKKIFLLGYWYYLKFLYSYKPKFYVNAPTRPILNKKMYSWKLPNNKKIFLPEYWYYKKYLPKSYIHT